MKVGDYVRTKYGIGKYIDDEVKSLRIIVIDSYIANDHNEGYKNVITRDEIIKSSPNIIDLIEVGDYVNGVEVIGFEKDNFNDEYLQCGVGDYVVCTYYETSIKSILTKEQFESMEYKV